jgi:hypothetical protein
MSTTADTLRAPLRRPRVAQEKRVDLAGSVGAGVLGLGLGSMLGSWFGPVAVPLLLVGAALHGWAMLARRQRERAEGTEIPTWSVALFWLCWAVLLALGVYLLLG